LRPGSAPGNARGQALHRTAAVDAVKAARRHPPPWARCCHSVAGCCNHVGMANLDETKTALHCELRWAREAMLGKMESLSEYDVRRPMTGTGTDLLGLIKQRYERAC